MSTVLILAPIIVANWPAISVAVLGAASAMGFVATKSCQEVLAEEKNVENVEIELDKSSIAAQELASSQEIVLVKEDVELRIKRDNRGRCVVCAKGIGYSKVQLKNIAQEFSGKLTQIFVYNQVMTELRIKGFAVANEEMMKDDSIRINVRHTVE
jgi:translation initiation factor 1 (eIF-1/SUI1)